MGTGGMQPVWFDSPAAFRAWLEEHHETESVDQALCFSWIDGVRRRVDDERYTIRFTPRKPGSNWSKLNVTKVAELERQGLMAPAGVAAFAARRDAATGVYSFEQDGPAELPPAHRHALGGLRQAGGDEAAPVRIPRGRLRRRPPPQAVHLDGRVLKPGRSAPPSPEH